MSEHGITGRGLFSRNPTLPTVAENRIATESKKSDFQKLIYSSNPMYGCLKHTDRRLGIKEKTDDYPTIKIFRDFAIYSRISENFLLEEKIPKIINYSPYMQIAAYEQVGKKEIAKVIDEKGEVLTSYRDFTEGESIQNAIDYGIEYTFDMRQIHEINSACVYGESNILDRHRINRFLVKGVYEVYEVWVWYDYLDKGPYPKLAMCLFERKDDHPILEGTILMCRNLPAQTFI